MICEISETCETRLTEQFSQSVGNDYSMLVWIVCEAREVEEVQRVLIIQKDEGTYSVSIHRFDDDNSSYNDILSHFEIERMSDLDFLVRTAKTVRFG